MRTQKDAIRDAEIYNEYQFGDMDNVSALKDKYEISEDKVRSIINKRRHYRNESLTRIKDDSFLCELYLDLMKHDISSNIASRIVMAIYFNKVPETIEDVKNWCVNYVPTTPDTNHPGYRNFGKTSYINLKRYLMETGKLTSEDEEKIESYNTPIIKYAIDICGQSIYYKTRKAAEADLKAFRVYESMTHVKRASEVYSVKVNY